MLRQFLNFLSLDLLLHHLLRWLNLTIIFIACWLFFGAPANALLRQHHEAPNVLRYHARDSLRDRDGNTWQVVLFPEDRDADTTYYLRLVGFPGVNSFIHPQPLEIMTQDKILMAQDAYAELAPAPNVGQYNLTPIIDRLPAKGKLKLAVPLNNYRELALKIPSEVLEEWQLLFHEIEQP